MMIKTILNNNAVIAIDENEKEVVIVKNGIGFNSKRGMVLKESDMECGCGGYAEAMGNHICGH